MVCEVVNYRVFRFFFNVVLEFDFFDWRVIYVFPAIAFGREAMLTWLGSIRHVRTYGSVDTDRMGL